MATARMLGMNDGLLLLVVEPSCLSRIARGRHLLEGEIIARGGGVSDLRGARSWSSAAESGRARGCGAQRRRAAVREGVEIGGGRGASLTRLRGGSIFSQVLRSRIREISH